MQLHVRSWGPRSGAAVVCVHGISQHGGIFEELGGRLAGLGHRVVAVDLRGHGQSESRPPWDCDSHVQDLLETVDGLGIRRATWIGHSFGGRLAAFLTAAAPHRVERLALLDPSLEVHPDYALTSAERDRLDWSFASVDSAVNALLSSDSVVVPQHDVVTAYAAGDLKRGADGRLRFSFSPSAVVVAWSEMVHPPPEIARCPTLLVRPAATALAGRAQDRRYRDELGSLLRVAVVPNGHNVLWEAPAETIDAITAFLATAEVGDAEKPSV